MAGSYPFAMRRATVDDAAWLAPNLRASDAMEVSASFTDAEAGIRLAIHTSAICDVGELYGEGAFVIGCSQNTDGDMGIPWLLGTDAVSAFPGALTKTTRAYVQRFRERWPLLHNYVDQRSVKSIRWLQALGFEIGEPLPLGLKGELFHPFTMKGV